MSCSCGNSNCSCCCDPSCEPLGSALNNFVVAFFGSVTKACVNGQVVWELPCDLETGIPQFPRLDGEGLACYFLRWMQSQTTGYTGTRSTVLSVFWDSPYLIQYKQDEVWENGRLMTITDPYVETIFIGVECP